MTRRSVRPTWRRSTRKHAPRIGRVPEDGKPLVVPGEDARPVREEQPFGRQITADSDETAYGVFWRGKRERAPESVDGHGPPPGIYRPMRTARSRSSILPYGGRSRPVVLMRACRKTGFFFVNVSNPSCAW